MTRLSLKTNKVVPIQQNNDKNNDSSNEKNTNNLRKSSLVLNPKTQEILTNVKGFINSKNNLNKITEKHLPKKFMNDYPSIKPESINELKQKFSTLDEIYDKANEVLPHFIKFVKDELIIGSLKLDPDYLPKLQNGEYLILDDSKDEPIYFTLLTIAPLKGRKRSKEKVDNEYDGDASRIIDVIRCSIVVETEDDLNKVAKYLQDSGVIVRLKNRFKEPLWNGYCDALYNIKIEDFICEVQLHLVHALALKAESHKYYAFFREFFAGNTDACKSRMKVLEYVFRYSETTSSLSSENISIVNVIRKLAQRDIYESDDDYINTLWAIRKLGQMLGDQDLSIYATRKIHNYNVKTFGDDHEKTLISLNNLALCLNDMNKLEEALPLYRECLTKRKQVLGDTHPHTLASLNNLAFCLNNMNKLEEALPLLRECLTKTKQFSGDTHPDTLSTLGNLANCLLEMKKLEEALPLYRECMTKSKQAQPQKIYPLNNLAFCLMEMKKFEEALPLFRECLPRYIETIGELDPHVLKTIFRIAYCLQNLDKYEEAVPLYNECLQKRKQVLGDTDPATIETIKNLNTCLKKLKRENECIKI